MSNQLPEGWRWLASWPPHPQPARYYMTVDTKGGRRAEERADLLGLYASILPEQAEPYTIRVRHRPTGKVHSQVMQPHERSIDYTAVGAFSRN